jgi:flagellar biogenesis protein FliO
LLFATAILSCLPIRAFAADDDSFENRPLVHRDNSVPAADPKSPAAQTPSSSFDAPHIALALTAVIGLIFALRAVARRFFAGAAPFRNTAAVKVLCRCAVSPRQHLLLIQFGKRLLLVGDSGVSLNPLCEIRDDDEVSALMSRIREESANAAHGFDSLFGLARKAFPHSTPPPPERFDDSHELNDPAVESTQKELSDLSEKVRDLAKQIGRA